MRTRKESIRILLIVSRPSDLYSPFASKRKERGMYVFGRPFLNVLRALDRKAGRTSKMSGS